MGTLSTKNYGAPTSKNIKLNIPGPSDGKTAQAWEVKGEWLYNYLGAMEEARARGERLPTINELMDTINSVPGKCEEKAKALNIPFTGLRDADHDIIISDGLAVGLWSSSSEDSRAGQYIYLFKFAISAANSCGNRGCGRLVRPFLDK